MKVLLNLLALFTLLNAVLALIGGVAEGYLIHILVGLILGFLSIRLFQHVKAFVP